MKRWYAVAPVLAAICLAVAGGCGDSVGETVEPSAEVKQLKTALEDAQRQKTQLEGDVDRLDKSLQEAESKLAVAKQAQDESQKQIQELTTSRGALETKVNDLTKSRVDLEAKVSSLTLSRDELQRRVDELTKSRDDLQTMVNNLVDTRGVLEKQVAALAKSRMAAIEDAKNAQAKVDLLTDRLKAQTQQMIDLQEQVKTIRSVLEQLQKKLE